MNSIFIKIIKKNQQQIQIQQKQQQKKNLCKKKFFKEDIRICQKKRNCRRRMEIIASHFNKKKFQFINFMTNFVNVIQRVSYQVQIQIDGEYNLFVKELGNLQAQKISQVCKKMEQDRLGFYEQIIDKLGQILKENTRVMINQQGKYSPRKDNNLINNDFRDINLSSGRKTNKNQANMAQKPIKNPNNQFIILGKTKPASQSLQKPIISHHPTRQTTSPSKPKSQQPSSLNFNQFKSTQQIKFQKKQSKQTFKQQIYQNNIRILSNEENVNLKNNQYGYSRQKRYESSPINRYQLDKNFPEAIYESIKIEKGEMGEKSRIRNQKNLIEKQEDYEGSNNRYDSPTRLKSKPKIQVLKRPDVCEGLDKLIHKQAKQMLQRSQSKSKFNLVAGGSSAYNSAKKSRLHNNHHYKRQNFLNQSPQNNVKNKQKYQSYLTNGKNFKIYEKQHTQGVDKLLNNKLISKDNSFMNRGNKVFQNSLTVTNDKNYTKIKKMDQMNDISAIKDRKLLQVSPIQKFKL